MYYSKEEKILKEGEDIEDLYNKGFLFTRKAPNQLYSTRSARIDLEKFSLTSENRRVLRKTDHLVLSNHPLPIPKDKYNWKIHKIGKTFYSTKFGDATFSASKIRELLRSKHNFNLLLTYQMNSEDVGYCICMQKNNIIHYSYPFYRLDINTNNIGMGMILQAIKYSLEQKYSYFYLGSITRSTDSYKKQFKGLEIFENNTWNTL